MFVGVNVGTHQHMGGSKQVAEWVVEQVDEWGSIQVSITHHLRGKQSLPRATAEQTTHHSIAHVHVMSHFLISQQRKSQNKYLMHHMYYHKDRIPKIVPLGTVRVSYLLFWVLMFVDYNK